MNGRCEAVCLNICNILNMQCLQGIYLHAKLITNKFCDGAWYSPSWYIDELHRRGGLVKVLIHIQHQVDLPWKFQGLFAESREFAPGNAKSRIGSWN